MTPRDGDLARIRQALEEAREVLTRFTAGSIEHETKDGGSPVTEADLAVDRVLRERLPRPGEGWLSEETADDPARLSCDRVWIVDPIDGTQEFVDGVPEWCVSIGLVENGRPVAGGIYLAPCNEILIGALGVGVTLDDRPCATTTRSELDGARVLASRSESRQGLWDRYRDAPFEVRPTGSVAFKLAQVACGRADATWTQRPKHEWDVAGGVALVIAAGGRAHLPGGDVPRFNRPSPRIPGLLVSGSPIADELRRYVGGF